MALPPNIQPFDILQLAVPVDKKLHLKQMQDHIDHQLRETQRMLEIREMTARVHQRLAQEGQQLQARVFARNIQKIN